MNIGTMDLLNDQLIKYAMERFPEGARNNKVIVRHKCVYTQNHFVYDIPKPNASPWMWDIQVSACFQRNDRSKFLIIGDVAGFGETQEAAFDNAVLSIFRSMESTIKTNHFTFFEQDWST